MTGCKDSRRKALRGSVAMPGRVRHNITRRANVAIADLSAHGCRIEAAEAEVAIGSPVFVRLDGLAPLRATVRWQDGAIAGLEFDHPLYIPVLDHLLKQWSFEVTPELETN